jgi:uncharacterized protein HemY
MEWNNGALVIIFLMFFIPVVLIYVLLQTIIKQNHKLHSYFKKEKEERVTVYFFIQIALIILSIGLTIIILGFINYIKDGRGILG